MLMRRVRKKQNTAFSIQWQTIFKASLFLLFCGSLFFIWQRCQDFFPIKSVRVLGVKHTERINLQEILTPLVKKGFFAIDVETIKDRLIQSPWISKAVVQRVWPNQVFITLIEKDALARWNHNGLISQTGELFSPEEKTIPAGLPQFVGPDGEQMLMLHYYGKMANSLSSLHFKIKRLELTPDHTWNLLFDNGIKLSVNNKDILTRMSHFVKVYPKIIGDRIGEVEYVDLRYQNGLSIRWKTLV